MTLEQAAGVIYGDPAALAKLDGAQVSRLALGVEEVRALVLDPSIQVRVGGVNPETVAAYSEVIANGGEFADPIAVFELPDGTRLVANGFHRVASYLLAADRDPDGGARFLALRCDLRRGDYDSALTWAEDANLENALPLSNADKKNILARRLERRHEWARLSNSEIARRLGVNDKTIGNWRRELEMTSENSEVREGPQERIGADGRTYRIGRLQEAGLKRAEQNAATKAAAAVVPSTPATPVVPTPASGAGEITVIDPQLLSDGKKRLLEYLYTNGQTSPYQLRLGANVEVGVFNQAKADLIADGLLISEQTPDGRIWLKLTGKANPRPDEVASMADNTPDGGAVVDVLTPESAVMDEAGDPFSAAIEALAHFQDESGLTIQWQIARALVWATGALDVLGLKEAADRLYVQYEDLAESLGLTDEEDEESDL